MKDIKNTLKSVATSSANQKSLWRRSAKKLWRTFLLLPLTAAIAVYGFFSACCTMMVPAAELHAQTGSWSTAFSLVSIDYLGIVLFIAGAMAAIFASWKAHHAMLGVVMEFPQTEMSKNRRNLLYVEVTALILLVLWVGGLPIVALLLSGIAAGGSSLGAAPIGTPLWVVISLMGLTALFVLALEITLTFVRLTFRQLPSAPQMSEDEAQPLQVGEETDSPQAGDEASNAIEVEVPEPPRKDAPSDFVLKSE